MALGGKPIRCLALIRKDAKKEDWLYWKRRHHDLIHWVPATKHVSLEAALLSAEADTPELLEVAKNLE